MVDSDSGTQETGATSGASAVDETSARRLEIIRKGLGGRTEPVRLDASAEEVESWMRAAAAAAAAKTDAPTIVLDVGEVLGITTWFVITSAGNTRLVKTIVDVIEEEVDKIGGPKPLRVEGTDSYEWVVVDYGDFVVHAFLEEVRGFYELERLYKDVPVVDWRS